MLFEKKISARKFATTDVDVFAEHVEGDMMKSTGRLAGPGRRKPKFVVEVGQSGPDNE